MTVFQILRVKLAYSAPAKWLSRRLAKPGQRPAWLRDRWAGYKTAEQAAPFRAR